MLHQAHAAEEVVVLTGCGHVGGNGCCSRMVRLGPHGCGDSGEAVSGVGGGLLGSNGGLWLGLEASVVAERARLSVLQ